VLLRQANRKPVPDQAAAIDELIADATSGNPDALDAIREHARWVGSGLLAAAERKARRRGLLRLELTVMADNLRALSLYLRSGFQMEGLRR
jgi:GNAT superfamily N-acetyltransferase